MGLGTNIAQNMTLANNFHGPPAGVTGAKPTGRRRGAGPPRRSAETVERPPLPVQEQGLSFRGTGSFGTRTGGFRAITGAFRARTGGFCAGTFLTRSPISFRRLLANSSEPTPPRNAPTSSPVLDPRRLDPPHHEQHGSISRLSGAGLRAWSVARARRRQRPMTNSLRCVPCGNFARTLRLSMALGYKYYRVYKPNCVALFSVT